MIRQQQFCKKTATAKYLASKSKMEFLQLLQIAIFIEVLSVASNPRMEFRVFMQVASKQQAQSRLSFKSKNGISPIYATKNLSFAL